MQKTLVQFLPGGGVDFYVFVLFEFVFLIRVPLSSSNSFSINMKRTIKTLHFLLILGNVWVQCNCQFRTILYILISYGRGTQSLQQVGFGDFFPCLLNHVFFSMPTDFNIYNSSFVLSEIKIVATSNETKKNWKEKQNQRRMGHNTHLSLQL